MRGSVRISSDITRIKFSGNLTGKCFEIRNAKSYTNRYCDTKSYYIIVLQAVIQLDKTCCSFSSILPEHRMYGAAIIG